MFSNPYLRLVRNIVVVVSLWATALYSLAAHADDAPPGSYYTFEASGARKNPVTKNLGVLVNFAESYGYVDGLIFNDSNACYYTTTIAYAGAPQCKEDTSKHSINCDALYKVVPENNICGFTTGRMRYASYRYLHYMWFDPDKGRGRPSCAIGNPCDPATGNKYEQVTDYAGGDHAPSFTRSFNSLPNTGTASALGIQWQHNYDRHITSINAYLDRPQYLSLNATRSDGKIISYFSQSGTWQSSKDIPDKLVQTASGWVYNLKTGATETYDSAGNLVKETDPTGLTTNLTYSGGKLATVTGPYGHTLTLGYDTQGRLVTLTDPNGKITRYGYNANNDLSTVSYPDSTGIQYHYEDRKRQINPTPQNPHLND